MQSIKKKDTRPRGGSRTAATSKMERFVIIVNGSKPVCLICKLLNTKIRFSLRISLVNVNKSTVLRVCSELTLEG